MVKLGHYGLVLKQHDAAPNHFNGTPTNRENGASTTDALGPSWLSVDLTASPKPQHVTHRHLHHLFGYKEKQLIFFCLLYGRGAEETKDVAGGSEQELGWGQDGGNLGLS